MMYHDKHSRSILKAISYRVLSITVDFVIVFLFTKKFELTLGLVVLTNTYSTFLYYFHERIWNKLHFGRVQLHKRRSTVLNTRNTTK